MLSYPLPEAETLLISKLETAQQSLANCEDDVDFLREQITVCFIYYKNLETYLLFLFLRGDKVLMGFFWENRQWKSLLQECIIGMLGRGGRRKGVVVMMMGMMGREEVVGWRGEMELVGERERKKWDVIFFFLLSLEGRQEEEEESFLFESYYHRYLCPRKQARQESFLGQIKKYRIIFELGQLTNRRSVTSLDEKKKKEI